MRNLPAIRTAGRHPTSLPLGKPAPWMADAACAESELPDAWFPDPGEIDLRRYAKRVCAACPVSLQCATEGWDEHFGIWGGITERARRTAREAQRRNGAA